MAELNFNGERVGLVRSLARLALEDGSSILVEAPDVSEGPVRAGRVGDAIRELPLSVQAALRPVTEMARTAMQQLREAGPDSVEIEFGVDLATQAGAVIARSEASCHLKVTVAWQRESNEETR
ncbi:CU044_2847 family protein [Streptomyces atratus]|uniref:CU044_2847 family protein n=1 Tax=Streptomyces atratus TaxID=1893 RepID=UPI0022566946|nr:CU044_2847 family protein [Streptomyces atratus]MCX5345993.1 CU044_2847 family protein [Streptomyces atratus]